MKTAGKVFIIIGMIVGFWMILPLIIGGITLSKLKTATCAEDIKVWALVDIFFCSLLGGILLLCCKDEDFAS